METRKYQPSLSSASMSSASPLHCYIHDNDEYPIDPGSVRMNIAVEGCGNKKMSSASVMSSHS